MSDQKELALSLAYAKTEEEVIKILKDSNLWDDFSFWRPFGDNENNFSTIGNQQSNADTSLVEKIINSIDAVLMKECMLKGIKPDDSNAPQSMEEALRLFYGIKDGKISYLDVKTRNEMSKNIILAATGTREEENIVLVDKGEGQTAKRMPDTILSISKNNKLKVPFVQGKFNMGGTGVLPFCGVHHFQLVITKRCQEIENYNNDETFSDWSFTIVRREEPREGRKSSMYTYLTDKNGNLFHFKSETLKIIPKAYDQKNDKQEFEDMIYGTYFKFFNYQFKKLKTLATLNLNYRLSILMPSLAHPVRIRECRTSFKANTLEATLSGLETRLADDRENNIEDGFPDSSVFYVDNQKIECSIYVFKKDKAKNYRDTRDGILFIVNGQTHAIKSDAIFSSKAKLSYIQDSLLVLLDCTNIDISHKEDLFMNSRDRLRKGDFSDEIEEKLIGILKNHDGLKELQNQRRQSAIKDKLEDDKPLQNVLNNIFSKSPVLSKIFMMGKKINNPFNVVGNSGEKEKFIGKKHPTFFTLKGKKVEDKLVKQVPINRTLRVQYETDVDNDYFTRADEKGDFVIKDNEGNSCEKLISGLNLFNGIANLNLRLPDSVSIGDKISLTTLIEDEYITQEFSNKIEIIVTEVQEDGESTSGKRKNPSDPKSKGDRISSSSLAMPNITEVSKENWESYGMNSETAMIVKENEDGSDYFLNIDNKFYLTELKNIKEKDKLSLSKAKYKYSMTLVAMSVESYYKNQEKNDENIDISAEIEKSTKMIAPILLPMIDAMTELSDSDI